MITRPSYTLSADMFDFAKGTMTVDVNALDVPEDYDSDRVHFYCSACARKEHYTRLKVVKAQTKTPKTKIEKKSKFEAPRRFNLFDHKDSNHMCSEAVRFQALENLAYRYNAGRNGLHKYEFSNRAREEQDPVILEHELKTVNRANRLAAITYFLMYDQGLMAHQQLRLGDISKKFRDGFFDASINDKKRIFQEALTETSMGRPFKAAVLFQPNPHRGVWKDYEDKYCLPATMGPNIDTVGPALRTVNLLWCNSYRTYQAVRAMADRDIERASAPLLVMGDVQLSSSKLFEAQERSKKSGKTETVYTVIKIDHANQVFPWDHDIKFEEAAANQNKVQIERRTAMVRAQQRGFDL